MSDIETRLERAGQQWQQSQPPPPEFDLRREPSRRQFWVPLAVAAAVVGLVALAVAIPRTGDDRDISPAAPRLDPAAVTATAPGSVATRCVGQYDFHGPWPFHSVPATALVRTVAGHLPSGLPTGFGLLDLERENADSSYTGGIATWTNTQCAGVRVYWLTPRPPDSGVAAFGPWQLTGGAGQRDCGGPSPCLEYEAKVDHGTVIVETYRLDRTTAEAIVRSVDLTSASPTPPPTRTPKPSTSTPPASPSSVHREDIDGDGQRDTLSLRWLRHSPAAPFRGVVRVTLDFGGGGKSSYDVRISRWIDPNNQEQLTVPTFAVAQVNGAGAGLEIIVTADDGAASYRKYRVLTVSGERQLVSLPPPARRAWLTGSSVGTGAVGYECGENDLQLVNSVPVRDGFAVRRTYYQWNGSDWTRLNTDRQVQHRPGPDNWLCYGAQDL